MTKNSDWGILVVILAGGLALGAIAMAFKSVVTWIGQCGPYEVRQAPDNSVVICDDLARRLVVVFHGGERRDMTFNWDPINRAAAPRPAPVQAPAPQGEPQP